MATINVGTGDYRYEVTRNWAQLPEGWSFGTISAVAADSKDRVYVFTRGEHPVIVFDPDGNFLSSWGEGAILDAHGIFISPDDHVYLVDRDGHQVLKYTTEGQLVMTLGTRGQPSLEAPFNHPAGAAVAPTGEIYVCDGYANSRVHKFSSDGKHMLSWGSPGSGPGQFYVPHGIWVDHSGRVYVADRENNRLQIFSSEGEFIAQWADLYRPTDIYMDKEQAVYVTDHIPRFSIFDTHGNLLSRGRLEDAVHSIWGDSHSSFYVALGYYPRVEKHVRIC